jgi:hypothetical protein
MISIELPRARIHKQKIVLCMRVRQHTVIYHVITHKGVNIREGEG